MHCRYPAALWTALLLLLFCLVPRVHAADAPTFSRDIAPILRAACISCHSPGKSAPFPLITYSDAHRRASQLVQVTQSRYMPPWKTTTHGFANERQLSDADRLTLKLWVENGAPEGEKLPKPPSPTKSEPEPWPYGTPNEVVTMAEPYSLPANTLETTRCFLLPAPIKQDRYLKAVVFRPRNPKVIRYISLYADTTGQGRKQAAISGGSGFFGFTGGIFPSPSGTLADWSPGALPLPMLEGTAQRIIKDSDLILQIRFRPSGKAETEQMQVGLYYAKEPTAGESVTLRLGTSQLYLPRQSTAVITDSFTLPTAVTLFEITPNVHFTAQTVTVNAQLPDGQSVSLLDIPDWDANWKQVYRLVSPIVLPSGTRLDLKITYNNTEENPRNPWRPSHRIVPGLEFMEEMGSVWLRLLPKTASDREALIKALPDPRHKPTIDIEDLEPEGPRPKPRPGPPTSVPPGKP